MCHEPLCHRTFSSLFLHSLTQLRNPRIQTIQQLQQILSSLTGPGRPCPPLQLVPSCFSPQTFLTTDALVQCQRLQLIHQSCTHLDHPLPVPQQLPQPPLPPTRYPDPRKSILQHQAQQQLRILSVRLLLPHSLRSNLGRVSDPQLELQLGQQTLKPSRLSAGLHADADPDLLLFQNAIELLRFLTMPQSAFLQLASFRIYVSDLLEARVIVTSYNQHVRLLSPEPWLVSTTKAYSGIGADIVMESITPTTQNRFRGGMSEYEITSFSPKRVGFPSR